MHILFFESSIPPYRGGVQRVTWLLRNYFLSLGHDVFFAYFLNDFKEVDAAHKLEFDVKDSEKKLKAKILSFILDNKIDIIILQGIFYKKIGKIMIDVRTTVKCKIIGCFHLSPGFEEKKQRGIIGRIKFKIKKKIEGSNNKYNFFFKYGDKLVLLSESFINEMIYYYKLPIYERNKICCIHNPLSFQETFEVKDVTSKKNIVLIISRIEECQKNLKSALRIWKTVESSGLVNDWSLILGGYGPSEQVIIDYAKQLKLHNFKFIGKVDKAQQFYKDSSLFMMTSRYEGFGMTITEAQQNGCVPIAFDNFSVLHDIIKNGYNGIIIPSEDEMSYANNIISLMLDRTRRQQMAKNAIKSSDKFSINVIGAKWINLFEELLNE